MENLRLLTRIKNPFVRQINEGVKREREKVFQIRKKYGLKNFLNNLKNEFGLETSFVDTWLENNLVFIETDDDGNSSTDAINSFFDKIPDSEGKKFDFLVSDVDGVLSPFFRKKLGLTTPNSEQILSIFDNNSKQVAVYSANLKSPKNSFLQGKLFNHKAYPLKFLLQNKNLVRNIAGRLIAGQKVAYFGSSDFDTAIFLEVINFLKRMKNKSVKFNLDQVINNFYYVTTSRKVI